MCESLWGWLEPANIIQCLIFLGLAVYAWDTRKIRKTSQEQNEIMQKPCLVPYVLNRVDIDVVADAVECGPYPEERVLGGFTSAGRVALHNIGNGPAFNIQYEVLIKEKPKKYVNGYLPYIPQGEEDPTPLLQLASNLDPGDQDTEVVFKLSYESLSGRHYDSKLHIRRGTRSELVVADCRFSETSKTTSRLPWWVKICR